MKHTEETGGGNLQLLGFDGFAHGIMRDWNVPSLALTVVKGDEVIFSQGFGKRDLADELEVTPHTLFPTASCTKAFTTTAMAILVDEGKLDWDTPVKHYIPTFKLYDTFAGERLTPRDLVTHGPDSHATISCGTTPHTVDKNSLIACNTMNRIWTFEQLGNIKTSYIWWQATWLSRSLVRAGKSSSSNGFLIGWG